MYYLNLGNYPSVPNALEYETSVFPHGEVHFRLKNNRCSRENVVILTRLNSSEDIMRLVMATDALRRDGYDKISCSIPYVPYSQQDRKCNLGEAHGLKVFADLINSLKFTAVVVLDPHSYVCEAVIDNLIVEDNSNFIEAVLEDINTDRLNVVVPDQGAAKKIYSLLPIFKEAETEVNLVICSKERDLSTSKITKTVVPEIDNDWEFLIIDDIVLRGLTFINIAKVLQERGQHKNIYLATTHGVYNNGFDELTPYFNKLYCTNSVREFSHPSVIQYDILEGKILGNKNV